MRLKRLAVQNVRSFGEKRTIEFHGDFTILIGPNAGGKSNLLDIITVGVRKFFVRPWGLTRHEDTTGPYYNFTSEDPFANFAEELPNYDGAIAPLVIEFDWIINGEDVRNLRSLVDGLDRFRDNAKHIRGGEEAVDWFKQLDPSEFAAGDTLQYKVEDGAIQSLSGDKGTRFRDFLQRFHKLSYVDEDAKLTTPFVHFPPYRGIGTQRLRLSLASQQRWTFE